MKRHKPCDNITDKVKMSKYIKKYPPNWATQAFCRDKLLGELPLYGKVIRVGSQNYLVTSSIYESKSERNPAESGIYSPRMEGHQCNEKDTGVGRRNTGS